MLFTRTAYHRTRARFDGITLWLSFMPMSRLGCRSRAGADSMREHRDTRLAIPDVVPFPCAVRPSGPNLESRVSAPTSAQPCVPTACPKIVCGLETGWSRLYSLSRSLGERPQTPTRAHESYPFLSANVRAAERCGGQPRRLTWHVQPCGMPDPGGGFASSHLRQCR